MRSMVGVSPVFAGPACWSLGDEGSSVIGLIGEPVRGNAPAAGARHTKTSMHTKCARSPDTKHEYFFAAGEILKAASPETRLYAPPQPDPVESGLRAYDSLVGYRGCFDHRSETEPVR